MRYAATLGLAIAFLGAAFAPSAQAARDQIVISGDVVVPRDATAGDVVIVEGPANIAGHVTGNVFAVHGVVTISGSVDGDVTTVTRRAVLQPSARVGGDLAYGDKKPVVAAGAVVSGKTRHENWELSGGVSWLLRLLLWVTVTISTLVLGLVLRAFAPRAADAAWVVMRERTGLASAWAAGLFFGVPIVAILAMITLVGLPLGLGLLLAYVPLTLVGYVTSCWLAGKLITGDRGWSPTRTFLAGWAALRVAALIPFVGGLLWVVAAAFGLGVLLLAGWYGSDPSRVARTAPAPST